MELCLNFLSGFRPLIDLTANPTYEIKEKEAIFVVSHCVTLPGFFLSSSLRVFVCGKCAQTDVDL